MAVKVSRFRLAQAVAASALVATDDPTVTSGVDTRTTVIGTKISKPGALLSRKPASDQVIKLDTSLWSVQLIFCHDHLHRPFRRETQYSLEAFLH